MSDKMDRMLDKVRGTRRGFLKQVLVGGRGCWFSRRLQSRLKLREPPSLSRVAAAARLVKEEPAATAANPAATAAVRTKAEARTQVATGIQIFKRQH